MQKEDFYFISTNLLDQIVNFYTLDENTKNLLLHYIIIQIEKRKDQVKFKVF